MRSFFRKPERKGPPVGPSDTKVDNIKMDLKKWR
jgi:hypothetical protein